jgi:hypothetical protein
MNDKHHPKTAARRGRRPMHKAKRDFLIADAIEEYEARLKAHQAKPGALPPHEAAAEDMQEKRKELGHIGNHRLRNAMAEFKKVDASDEVAPDRYDPPDHIPEPRRRR